MAVPQTNQLSIPFRRATQLSLAAALRQYVTDKYGQHPDTFRHDLEVIDTLRRDAVNVQEPHPSGIKKLQAYAAQLAWIGGKFPVEVGAEFTWYPSLGYNTDRPLVQNNLKYELVNILYNLAALYCQLAANTGHMDADGPKTAASYFAQAAGVLQHIRETLLADADVADLPEDLDAATLASLEQLMLAQAQECFWMRAASQGYKDATIAKLAARLSDLYNTAGEEAVRSDAVSRAWIHHMSAKHHHFAAAAQYRASLDCLEKQKYGEEVARLQDALFCATEGLKEGRSSGGGGSSSNNNSGGDGISKMVLEDLGGLKRRVEEDLKRAVRDNDIIYLQVVPPKSELKVLDRANMAVARVPLQVATPLAYVGEAGAEFGAGLFSQLVPFAAHLAVTVYEERRDRLVNQDIVQDLERLTEQLHDTLLALHLPGSLQAAERPLGLPGTLVQHAEEIRYAEGLVRIQRSFADIDKLRAGDLAIFEEGRALLEVERDEDAALRRQYGTARWTRAEAETDQEGHKLWANAAEIEGYFGSSGSSDGVVRDMFASVQETLALLAGPERALMDFVPNSRRVEVPETVKAALGRLRSAYNDVLRAESRRRKRVEALRDKARADDVKPDIMKETARLERAYPHTAIVASHFDAFFDARLRDRYDGERALVAKEAADQDKVLEDVARAHREVEAQKRHNNSSQTSTGDHHRAREAALQTLDAAYYKYKEIVKNVEVGRKFYNDLSRIAGAFRDQCRSWVQQRRDEAQALEEELSMPVLSSLSLGHHAVPAAPAPASDIPPAFSVQQPPVQSWAAASGTPQQPIPIPAAAPQPQQTYQQPYQQPTPQAPQAQPQQMWTPSMGIRFGQPGAVGNPPAPTTSRGNQPSGTWDPSSGIRFG